MLQELVGERRAIKVRRASQERFIDAADAGVDHVLGSAPPGGLPSAFLDDVPDALTLSRAPLRADAWPVHHARVPGTLRRRPDRRAERTRASRRPRPWRASARWQRTRAVPSRSAPVPAPCLARRCSARRSSPPTSARSPASCPRGRGSTAAPPPAPGSTDSGRSSSHCRGWRSRPRRGSGTCLPRRVGAYSPAWMDQLSRAASSSGSAPARSGGTRGGWRSTSARILRSSARPPPNKGAVAGSDAHALVRERLARGASFFTDLLVDVELAPEALQEALWDLVWAGEATNDAFAPLRAPRLTLARAQRERARTSARRSGRFTASRRRGMGASAQVQGRWSLTAPLFGADDIDPVARRRAIGELLLERYGILTREQVLAEGIPGGFSGIYSELPSSRRSGPRGAGTSSRGSAALSSRCRGGRATPRDERPGGSPARAGRHRPGAAVRRRPAVAAARRGRGAPPGPDTWCLRRARRRRTDRLPRARRQGVADAYRAR